MGYSTLIGTFGYNAGGYSLVYTITKEKGLFYPHLETYFLPRNNTIEIVPIKKGSGTKEGAEEKIRSAIDAHFTAVEEKEK